MCFFGDIFSSSYIWLKLGTLNNTNKRNWIVNIYKIRQFTYKFLKLYQIWVKLYILAWLVVPLPIFSLLYGLFIPESPIYLSQVTIYRIGKKILVAPKCELIFGTLSKGLLSILTSMLKFLYQFCRLVNGFFSVLLSV